MLRVTVLGSGSRGNAILIDGTEGAILVDAGFGPRAIARRMALAGHRPESVQGLFLTHEHVDHACGATAACLRWKWPVHATSATLAALGAAAGGAPETVHTMVFSETSQCGGFRIDSSPIPHDSASCAALVVTDTASGARVGIALDLGHVPDALPDFLGRCDLLVVESNHDERMLAEGPYPWPLKRRVGGPLGHLSNGAAAALIAAASHSGLRGVVLAHLSETNNTPEVAAVRTREALRRAGWRRDAIFSAAQSVPCGPIGAHGAIHVQAAPQLALGL